MEKLSLLNYESFKNWNGDIGLVFKQAVVKQSYLNLFEIYQQQNQYQIIFDHNLRRIKKLRLFAYIDYISKEHICIYVRNK